MTLALAVAFALMPLVADAQLMIIGNDDKIAIDKTGKLIRQPPGKDPAPLEHSVTLW
ncbi:MAG TPA: hypothetical protein VMT97_01705 [Terriglobales bacterium]|nr:hypothetical protein [Terriglobales bacterium]